ncbi:MAG: hypothetical protein H0W25_09265, partial [Acidimicrobiia bacterium]|nr:hypothetical protein [Acidimicrobiia bacterium]
MERRVLVLPHTHWDREWYEPFEGFRSRLVGVVGEVLDVLEGDPAFRCFHLDGQTAAVDDHLAVVPADEARVRRLVEAGRLTIGPWVVLADSFLPSGETLARNLERGRARAARLGGSVPVGWMPDSFGHAAQLPQLLRLAGIRHAVIWRGVPSAVDRTAFRWEAPDGSGVRAEVLPAGYDVGGYLPADPAELVARIEDHLTDLGDRLVGEPLWPQGGDHHPIRRELPAVLAAADATGSLRFEIVGPGALAATDPDDPGLDRWAGELRSGYRSSVLAGVTSTRLDVKAAAAAAEVALERVAEPLAVMALPAGDHAHALVDRAWELAILNAAHDSTCGCSADATVAEVLGRYGSVAAIARSVTTRALAALAPHAPAGTALGANTVARTRRGLVELDLPGEGPVVGAQVLDERSATLLDLTVPAAVVAPLLDRIRTQQVNDDTWVVSVDLTETDDLVDVVARCDRQPGARLDLTALRARAEALVAARPDRDIRIRAVQAPSRRAVALVGPVPGFGVAVWRPGDEPADVEPVVVDGHRMANGLVDVAVDPATGTFTVDGTPGFGALIDDAEGGDTYTHEPVPGAAVVDEPVAVAVVVEERGPLRARIRIDSTWRWVGADRETTVATTVEVRAGERLVRVAHSFVNTVGDHRLRALVPLPAPAPTVTAGCAFAAVERDRTNEGGVEAPCPTAPARRFLLAGRLAVVQAGAFEYELLEGGSAVALTVLRSVG